jgi:hypothetical protein
MKIVYTPDIEMFKRRPLEFFDFPVLNPQRASELQNNFQRLETVIGTVPATIGVVTYCDLAKSDIDRHQDALKIILGDKSTTTYAPLDIWKAVLAMREEKINTRLDAEFVYRTLSSILENPLCMQSWKNWEADAHGKALITTFPIYTQVANSYNALISEMNEAKAGDSAKIVRKIQREMRKCIRWDLVEQALLKYSLRFADNKVSRTMPLYYAEHDYVFTPETWLVTFEKPGRFTENGRALLKSWEYFAKLCGPELTNDETYQRELKHAKETSQMDRFLTEQVFSLENMLALLPEPKLIITDIYIVDRLPQLKGKFEAVEFTPAK